MDSELREDRCETCRFWEWMGNEPELDESFGRCRRLPPTINLTAAKHFFGDSIGDYVNEIGVWPHTVAWDWCGEHQTRTGYGWQPVATVEEVMAVANSPPSA